MRFITLKNGEKYYFDRMKIMGILNATPDSFYEGSRFMELERALNRAEDMIKNGVDIIDIGGESTRPGSEPVGVEEEIKRVVPVIEAIREKNKNILISVDTYRAETARRAIEAGADIINDISGMTFDKDMVNVVKEYNVPIIIMHIKGTPKDMQKNPQYDNVLKEVKDYFIERIEYALKNGISKDKIILDPGIGFGKAYEHNIELIKNIDYFSDLNVPILLAVSRKSSIGIALGNVPPEDRLEGTIAVTCYASMKNVDIIRVHDVLENKRALMMMEALK
ncbi:dihydropteroate synthase [Thermobrachium celere]|uniref:Dihydropteroate synthase n=1 Tax=Thermobrachium celere DSM 8682 TaxID=941824 RepID=R7RQN7_9CLOT|nr:dihydropteroate synthase [Thermobrachium celere]CDF58399.1 Dihydropteroate synthase [Thermobrachium celere DSM 8682]